MKKRLIQLGKDSSIYGVGGALAKCVGFLLLPVYTRVFSPVEYGVIEMLVVLNSLLAAILVMGMDSAQSFYFFEQKNKGMKAQKAVVSAILQLRFVWGIIILIAAMLLSPVLNSFFFDGELLLKYFVVAFVGVFFAQLMGQSAEVYRLLYRPWYYIGLTLGRTLFAAALTLIFVFYCGWGIFSFFAGMALSAAVMMCAGWFSLRQYVDFAQWHRKWWPKLIRFGAPLVPAAMGMYVLNTSDRWFLVRYWGADEVGLYAVGAKFAMLVALIVTTFRKAWWPVAMDAVNSPDGRILFRIVGRLYLGLASAGVVVLTGLAPLLVSWLTPPAFHGTYPIIGILTWHSVFYGFFLIGAIGAWKAEKTYWAPIGIGLAAALNIVLNFLLVPRFGGVGAAAATSISFLIWNIFSLYISERLWPVNFPVKIFAMQLSIGVGFSTSILLLQLGNAEMWKVALLTFGGCLLLIRSAAALDNWSQVWRYAVTRVRAK